MDLNCSIAQYVDDIETGTYTCEEFIQETIQQIGRHEETIHAYISMNEGALEQARAVDRRIKAGRSPGRCRGLPVSIKDNICVKDTRTTCASRMLEEFVAPYDATVVARLRAEDAIFMGKTNMDEFAMGITTEFSAYGPSRNPWNTDYVPGGSSGGSAVAVSSMECMAALGSDTGGSVRNPASFCGLVGIKPTYGLVSRYGLISYANSIEQIGPITRTVQDAAFMLDVISGMDKNDDTTVEVPGGSYLEGLDSGVDGKRFGVVQQMMGEGTSPEVAAATRKAVSKLEGLGASCEEISLDMVDYSVASYYTITAAEAGSNLARYDNILYGHDFPQEGYGFNSYISRARRMFGPEVTRRIILGGFVPSAGHAGKYYLKALHVRNRLAQEVGEALKKVDYLVSPTVPVLPFKLGEKIDDPVALFLVDFNTVTANLTGRPAVSVPFEVHDGLPIGVQLLGDMMGDRELLQAAYALQGTASLPEVPI